MIHARGAVPVQAVVSGSVEFGAFRATTAISKRMRVPVEVVRPVYQPHENVLQEIPYVRRDSVQAIFDQYPKEQLKNLTYEKLTDNSLLQQIEDSGFIKTLYRK